MSIVKSFVFSVCILCCIGCSINDRSDSPNDSTEIVFGFKEDMDITVDTKAAEVNKDNLSSVYWEASDGSSVVHAVSAYPVSNKKVSTGKFWPSLDVTYSYMVSNVSFSSGTGVINADNGTDIVVGVKSGVTRNSYAEVNLDHIFARTGIITLNTQEGYILSNVSWRIASSGVNTGTSGTYTIGSGWGSSTASLPSTTLDSSSDLYLIPGSYTVTVSYTLSRDSYSESFTKSGNVVLSQGMINNMSATATGGAAAEIEFGIELTPWSSVNKNVSF